MTCVYVHVPECYGTPLTYPIKTTEEEAMELTFGAIKQALREEFIKRNGPYSLPEFIQFYNEWKHPVKDSTVIGNAVGTDFVLKQVVVDKKVVPDNIHPDIKKAVVPSAPVTTNASDQRPKYNSRQSPFGTDIQSYVTLNEYTWEDSVGQVKVLVMLKDVGKLPKENFTCNFGPRQFELLIRGYNGKNYRLACSKTHAPIDFEHCSYQIRPNRVNVILKKAGEADTWYELFKTRAVGEKPDDC